jgi:hypothetical protein
MRGMCDFLGINWNDAMRDFADKARARGVDTPSAAQISKGLYKSGAGQWRAWASQMKSVLPLLAPWCAALGYEEA